MPGTLAIDMGSSTTVVAWQEDGEAPRLLPLAPYSCEEPEPVVPSLLWLDCPTQRHPLIGRQVLDAGLADRPAPGLLRDFKRRIGAGVAPQGTAAASMGWLTPEQAGALLLQRLWESLPAELEPRRLVLTAPIETYRGYRQWLQQASGGLPLGEVALVDEPTAAAIGAGLPAGSRVLVVDVGGGTLDLSLVALEGGEGRAAPLAQLLRFGGRDLVRSGQVLRTARVIGKAGIALGGRDIDHWIAAELCPGETPEGSLLKAAEQLKCLLSEQQEALAIWSPGAGQPPRELRLDQRSFARLLESRGLIAILDELLECVLSAARGEGLSLGNIHAVLPVGGGSRIPLVRSWLERRCEGVAIRGERPVAAVALGALALTPGVRVKDVLSRGVSLRCWDRRSGRHHWHPLFVAGQGWPSERPLELVLACGREAQPEIELVLGEPVPEQRSEVVFKDGMPVLRGRDAGSTAVNPWGCPPVRLALTPPGRRGEDRLRLRFQIATDGVLVMEGEDLARATVLESRRLGPVR